MRASHERDAVAMIRFLKWLDDNKGAGHTEWTAACQLEEFRAAGEHYRGVSFHTISAVGANAAHPHYALAAATAAPLQHDQIYLVDSGGQYLDGTTDITRTFILGQPTAEMKRRYTQVLKGHVALAAARFPEGTSGSALDALARQYLWEDGVDFDHGTGHGVGCYLSVHEGPQNISKRPSPVALRPGMVVSDEPGYYKGGAFGIRIENLVVVVRLDPQPAGAEVPTLGFETLTLVPYERELIELSLLTPVERRWIDAYHARIRSVLTPRLEGPVAAFLATITAPLADA